MKKVNEKAMLTILFESKNPEWSWRTNWRGEDIHWRGF